MKTSQAGLSEQRSDAQAALREAEADLAKAQSLESRDGKFREMETVRSAMIG